MPKRKADDYSHDTRRKSRRKRVIWSDSDSDENSSIGAFSTVDELPLGDNAALECDVLAAELTPAPAPLTELVHGPALDAPHVAVTNTPTEEEPAQPKLNSDILAALGAQTGDGPLYGDVIHENLSQLWSPLLRKGLSKEDRDKLLKDHPIPRNCTLLQAPKLNLEISAAITESAQNRDKKLVSAQQQLGVGITAVNRALDILLLNDGENKLKIIKHLSDACRILCDLHHTESQARIKLVTPSLEKSFLNVVQETTRDETLFGSKLSEKIKSSKAIEKQGLQIKKSKPINPVPSTSTPRPAQLRGNWTAPPHYSAPKAVRGGTKRPAAPRKAPAQAPVAKQPSKSHTRAQSRQ